MILTLSIQSTVTVCKGCYSYIKNIFSYDKKPDFMWPHLVFSKIFHLFV
jgi:hypothetical protein